MIPILHEVKKSISIEDLAMGLGMTKQGIYLWRRVPAEHVLNVERLSGVSRGKLRPDLYPD